MRLAILLLLLPACNSGGPAGPPDAPPGAPDAPQPQFKLYAILVHRPGQPVLADTGEDPVSAPAAGSKDR